MERGTIADRIYDRVKEEARGAVVDEVRIGLGYVGVKLDNGAAGVAAVLRRELGGGCSVLAGAGTLAGTGAEKILALLVEGANPIEKALGLAVANALIGDPPDACGDDTIDLMKLTPHDRVGMVGFFGPLVKKIRGRGIELAISERDPERGDVHGDAAADMLRSCTVAIITATTILNGTLEETLGLLGTPRHVTLLGPSTPMVSDVFDGTPVTHLGGSVVTDVPKVLQVISEGGGTQGMKPHVRFVSVIRGRHEKVGS